MQGISIFHAVKSPNMQFSIFDDGKGMTESELTEAMRLSSKNPDEIRSEKDLGKIWLRIKKRHHSHSAKN